MTAEKLTVTDADAIRIATIRLAHESGMRTGTITQDSGLAPWLIGGLKALEEGRELSSELLQDLDVAQNMSFHRETYPVKAG